MPSSLVLMRVAAVSILLAAVTHTTADPDLWGHVRFGRDIVAAQAVPTTDSYAFTSEGSWVNHEYLAEVIMFSSYAAAGSAGLIGLKLILSDPLGRREHDSSSITGSTSCLVEPLGRRDGDRGRSVSTVKRTVRGPFVRVWHERCAGLFFGPRSPILGTV